MPASCMSVLGALFRELSALCMVVPADVCEYMDSVGVEGRGATATSSGEENGLLVLGVKLSGAVGVNCAARGRDLDETSGLGTTIARVESLEILEVLEVLRLSRPVGKLGFSVYRESRPRSGMVVNPLFSSCETVGYRSRCLRLRALTIRRVIAPKSTATKRQTPRMTYRAEELLEGVSWP